MQVQLGLEQALYTLVLWGGEGYLAFLSLVPMTTISCLLSAVGLVGERPLVAHLSLVSLQDPRLETFPICLPEFFYLFYNTSGSWPVFKGQKEESDEFRFYCLSRGNVFLPRPWEQNDFCPFPRGLGFCLVRRESEQGIKVLFNCPQPWRAVLSSVSPNLSCKC